MDGQPAKTYDGNNTTRIQSDVEDCDVDQHVVTSMGEAAADNAARVLVMAKHLCHNG